jgi:hypothetical protein
MLTLYDIYPYSAEDLPEFRHMMEFPSQIDTSRFADTALSLLGSDMQTSKFREEDDTVYRYRDFLFSEGMLGISEVYFLGQADELLPVGFEVEVSLSSRPNDFSQLRNLIIRTGYSESQLKAAGIYRNFAAHIAIHNLADFDEPPRLLDFGISDLSDPAFVHAIQKLPPLDSTQPPSGIDIQPSTLTENLEIAEYKDRAEDFVDELLERGLLEKLIATTEHSTEAKRTVVSKLTLRKLTRFLMTLNEEPSY